ncbi:hypothetical protein DNTS_012427 [Danionella cerebrum]|uniref:Uncharacterized protein n=1 Tax=Danionella cerebrum TaxID=2873325 RepID=A0A553N3F3_9TELE|nr:hypothetical protein DNTS_012427 [Danionella translucida]
MCRYRSPDCVKRRSHHLHACGFSRVCTTAYGASGDVDVASRLGPHTFLLTEMRAEMNLEDMGTGEDLVA